MFKVTVLKNTYIIHTVYKMVFSKEIGASDEKFCFCSSLI